MNSGDNNTTGKENPNLESSSALTSIAENSTSSEVKNILSRESILLSPEFREFMNKMRERLGDINALLNTKESLPLEILQSLEKIIQESSNHKAYLNFFVNHGFVSNEVVFNIFFDDINITNSCLGIDGNVKRGDEYVRGGGKISDIDEIEIPDRNDFLDYIEIILKKMFEAGFGKGNVNV